MKNTTAIAFIAAFVVASVPIGLGASAQPAQGRGVWEVPAYGYVLAETGDTVTVYGRAGAYCDKIMQIPAAIAASQFGARTDMPDGRAAVFATSASRYLANRLPTVPPECAKPAKSKAPLATFDAVWDAMNAHYGFFDVREMDWAAARAAYRPRAAAAKSADELWAILTEMLGPLRDTHVSLERGKETWSRARHDRATAPDPDGITPNGRPLIAGLKAWLSGPMSPLTAPPNMRANDRMMTGLTRDGLCYIAITSMGGYTGSTLAPLSVEQPVLADALDATAKQCASARGTLIDLRYNPGGDDRLGLEIVSRLITEPRAAWQKRARGPDGWTAFATATVSPTTRARLPAPVAVLVGVRTISAAETTAVALQAAAGAVVVGSPAQGALSDSLSKPLPNGWTLTLSNEDYAKPDGTRLEGPGLQPDVPVDVSRPATVDERFGKEIAEASAALARGR